MAKARLPRAIPPVCWVCGNRLWAQGTVYVEVLDAQGVKHPAHKRCARTEAQGERADREGE